MKFNHKQLDLALSRLKNMLINYGADATELEVDITLTQADPGNGAMVDCITLSAIRPKTLKDDEHKEDLEVRASIEVYATNEHSEPRALKTETFKVKKKY